MPVFPFFAGLAVGVVALRLSNNKRVRTEIKDVGQKLRQGSAKAESKLRRAAVSGLDALAGSSARLRDRLEAAANQETAPEEAATPAEVAATPAEATESAEKPRARRAKSKGSAQ
ncbi:hypothetical protein AGMMS49960_10130 [Betaproteobacteria bacterium]|nr:hypothetical protein AGMMS49960_10130 [Betaproteobacteria bacterium]GHU19866.1 hypothetical protein AGMMS50243_12930 [Betaproteobacteria bacterium]